MYRVCLTKDGKIIEVQSGGKVDRHDPETLLKSNIDITKYHADCDNLEAMRLDTLRQNALNAGYKEDEIEVKWIDEAEWATIQEANKPKPTYADLRRAEWPACADYLDGIVKGDQLQIDKYIADCLAVKAKYPKN